MDAEINRRFQAGETVTINTGGKPESARLLDGIRAFMRAVDGG
jgi:hypothetical protein